MTREEAFKKKESFEKKAKTEQEALMWLKKYMQKNGETFIYTETGDAYSSFDAWVCLGSEEYITEVKVRKDVTGAQIDKWGGPLLQHNKHAGMVEYKEKFGHENDMLYVNFFKDEVRIYKLRKDPTYYSWFQKKLPKYNYNKQLVWKWVVELQPEDLIKAIKYGK